MDQSKFGWAWEASPFSSFSCWQQDWTSRDCKRQRAKSQTPSSPRTEVLQAPHLGLCHFNLLWWQSRTSVLLFGKKTNPIFLLTSLTPDILITHIPFLDKAIVLLKKWHFTHRRLNINPYFADNEAQVTKTIMSIETLLCLNGKSTLGGEEIVVQALNKNCCSFHTTWQILCKH